MFGARVVLAAGLLVLALPAFCIQPTRFNYQAQLKNAGGSPLTGNHSGVFRIYQGGTLNGANSGTLKYEESASFNLVDGIVNHAIGTGVPIGASLSAGVFATSSDLFVQVAVDGNTVLPRSRLESVPFALSAANGDLRLAIDPSAPGFTTPYTISQPGSYYLAGNLTVNGGDAILISTNSVTLDLNGYTITSTAPANIGSGVLITSGFHNITIRNGKIAGGVVDNAGVFAGPGFVYGISYSDFPSEVDVSDISVYGVSGGGIYLSPQVVGSTVDHCSVSAAGDGGIAAGAVRNCQVTDVGTLGIYAYTVVDSCSVYSGYGTAVQGSSVSNSVGITYGNNPGISATEASNCHGFSFGSGEGVVAEIVTNCYGYSVIGIGVHAQYMAENCRGKSDGNHGLECDRNAVNCQGTTSHSGSYGLWVKGTANNCNGANSNLGSEIAIKATIAIGCTTDGGIADVPAGNKFLGTP